MNTKKKLFVVAVILIVIMGVFNVTIALKTEWDAKKDLGNVLSLANIEALADPENTMPTKQCYTTQSPVPGEFPESFLKCPDGTSPTATIACPSSPELGFKQSSDKCWDKK